MSDVLTIDLNDPNALEDLRQKLGIDIQAPRSNVVDLDDPKTMEALKQRLDDLGREDPERGARLHEQKNSVGATGGSYGHLGPEILRPAYTYRAYPKWLYPIDYPNDNLRDRGAILVKTESEHRMRAGSKELFESPTEATQARIRAEERVSEAAAHLAYEDRNLTGRALEERNAADDASEGHLVEVKAPPVRPHSAVISTPGAAKPSGARRKAEQE